MSTQTDDRERRRFSQGEFEMMLDVGILSPREGATLDDGTVMVPDNGLARRFPPVGTRSGPEAGTVPGDQVVAEVPTMHRLRDEVEEIMNAMAAEAQIPRVRRKFTVDEYYQMAEVGILSPDERVELLAGEIFVMAAMGSRHAGCINIFNRRFQQNIDEERAITVVQIPVLLDNSYVPLPDLMLLKPVADFYMSNLPTGADVLLVVEVGNTTTEADRRDKLPAYAQAGIPETWLADVNAQIVEVHTEPVDGVYTRWRVVGLDGVLTPTAFPDVAIAVRDVMRW